jgi:hypothetical protein
MPQLINRRLLVPAVFSPGSLLAVAAARYIMDRQTGQQGAKRAIRHTTTSRLVTHTRRYFSRRDCELRPGT